MSAPDARGRLLLIVVVALALRLLVFATIPPDVRKFYIGDSYGYDRARAGRHSAAFPSGTRVEQPALPGLTG